MHLRHPRSSAKFRRSRQKIRSWSCMAHPPPHTHPCTIAHRHLNTNNRRPLQFPSSPTGGHAGRNRQARRHVRKKAGPLHRSFCGDKVRSTRGIGDAAADAVRVDFDGLSVVDFVTFRNGINCGTGRRKRRESQSEWPNPFCPRHLNPRFSVRGAVQFFEGAAQVPDSFSGAVCSVL